MMDPKAWRGALAPLPGIAHRAAIKPRVKHCATTRETYSTHGARHQIVQDKLLDHDHSELEGLLAEFFRALDRKDAGRGHDTLDLFWARLAVHIRAEHLHLFPALLHLPVGTTRPAGAPSPETVKAATDKLRQEHDFFMNEIFAGLKLLRKLPGLTNKPEIAGVFQSMRQRMSDVSERLHQHNEHEETLVYRWAENWLPRAELVILQDHMRKELAHLPPRFDPTRAGLRPVD